MYTIYCKNRNFYFEAVGQFKWIFPVIVCKCEYSIFAKANILEERGVDTKLIFCHVRPSSYLHTENDGVESHLFFPMGFQT